MKTLRPLTKDQKFMVDQLEGFKDFVLDSMDEGMHKEATNHLTFLENCMEVYIDMQDEPDEDEE